MAIDLKQSWGDASSKISSFNTIKETKDVGTEATKTKRKPLRECKKKGV